MELTSYPVLVEIQSEMSRMKIIYDLYSSFEKFREDMSLTAWGELDVELLKEGVDKAEKEIKKLPKELKELSKYKAYELVVVSFKESLPVIVNLKNDAVKQARARRPVRTASGGRRGGSESAVATPPMRSRDMTSTQAHWSQLEELTGVSIGDVKTITLGKIFSMELSQYGEDVDEIVVCADSASFLPVSELQVRVAGVFMIIRGSTHVVTASVPRRRDQRAEDREGDL
jgi:hypothetical protein